MISYGAQDDTLKHQLLGILNMKEADKGKNAMSFSIPVASVLLHASCIRLVKPFTIVVLIVGSLEEFGPSDIIIYIVMVVHLLTIAHVC